jgi:hypothetical protein
LCDTCQRVKAEHQRPAGLLQPLKIPKWKWGEIGMDFIVSLPHTQAGYDSVWVIMDRLTKVAHFILVDEDIPTHDDSPVAIEGPITRAHARQLQYQVKLFLSSTLLVNFRIDCYLMKFLLFGMKDKHMRDLRTS